MNKQKEKQLKHFRIENAELTGAMSTDEQKFAVDVLKMAKQRGLTYVGAYAGLELAYRQMRYESNFLQVQ